MHTSRASKLLVCHTASTVGWGEVFNSFTCTLQMVGAARSLAVALTALCAQAAQPVATTCAHKASPGIAAKTSLLTWLCEQCNVSHPFKPNSFSFCHPLHCASRRNVPFSDH